MAHPDRSGSFLTLAVVIALTVGILPAAQASVASAAIRLSPDIGPPTRPITIQGRGFGAREMVLLDWDDSPLATALTDAKGEFSHRVRIPANAVPGDHVVTATGEDSGEFATATFLVRTNWRRFHFDSANTGHNPFENVLNTSNVSELKVKWSVPTSPGAAPSPVVWGGRVYVSPADGLVRALDASTGATIWSTDVGGTGGLAPDVEDAVVYVENYSGVLFALDAGTGGIVWKRDLGVSMGSPPNGSDGIVYASALVQIEFPSGIRTFGLDATTGTVLWKRLTAGAPIALAVTGGLVYTTGWGALIGMVEARDAHTGAFVWDQENCAESCGVSAASSGDGLVFVDYDYRLWALDAFTGKSVWRSRWVGVAFGEAPAVADGVVYLGNLEGDLLSWDGTTGAPLWRAPLPGGTDSSSPAVANGVLYIGSEDGRLRAYDAETGEILWESEDLGSPFRASPAVADGVVYGATKDGTVYAFGLP